MAEYSAIVNGIITPAELPCILHIRQANWEEVKEALDVGTPYYIRHPSTAKLLGAEPNAGFYAPKAGDVYFVLRLKAGTAPRGAEVEVKIEDLDILRVEVISVSITPD